MKPLRPAGSALAIMLVIATACTAAYAQSKFLRQDAQPDLTLDPATRPAGDRASRRPGRT